ncbi:cellulose binding domain-containing protein, partial [Streptomyces sp. NPDC052644]
MRLVHRRPLLAGTLAAATLVGVVGVATAASAATGCRVTYTVSSQWNGGFGANVAVTNLGDPLNGWQ